MTRATTGFRLADFVPYRMNVLASRISRELATVYGGRFGLTIPEWRILAHLNECDGVSVREIQGRVDMDKVKVTRAAQRLEAAGLVTKHIDPADRRLVQLALTDAGRARISDLLPYVKDYEESLLDVLDATERAAFLEALDKLERATGVAPSGRHDVTIGGREPLTRGGTSP